MKRISLFHFREYVEAFVSSSNNGEHGCSTCAGWCGFRRGNRCSTGYTVQINETITNGFTHPGVGVTKAILENMRTQVLAQKEPWYSYYKAMTVSSAASKTVTSSNQSSTDPSKPASDAFNSQGFNSRFISDGLKAYTQALMYYITERRDLSGQCDAYHPHLVPDGSCQIPIFHGCAYPCRHPAQPDGNGGGDFKIFHLSNTRN